MAKTLHRTGFDIIPEREKRHPRTKSWDHKRPTLSNSAGVFISGEPVYKGTRLNAFLDQIRGQVNAGVLVFSSEVISR